MRRRIPPTHLFLDFTTSSTYYYHVFRSTAVYRTTRVPLCAPLVDQVVREVSSRPWTAPHSFHLAIIGRGITRLVHPPSGRPQTSSPSSLIDSARQPFTGRRRRAAWPVRLKSCASPPIMPPFSQTYARAPSRYDSLHVSLSPDASSTQRVGAIDCDTLHGGRSRGLLRSVGDGGHTTPVNIY
jgi:hypothetical protein